MSGPQPSPVNGVVAVYISHERDHQQYGYPEDDTYEYEVSVAGVLRRVDFITPWGQHVDSNWYVPANWKGEYIEVDAGAYTFTATTSGGYRWMTVTWETLTGSQWDATFSAQTHVQVRSPRGGWWSAVDYAGTFLPNWAPHTTTPAYNQTGVPANTSFQWDAWAGYDQNGNGRLAYSLSYYGAETPITSGFLSSGATSTNLGWLPAGTWYDWTLAFQNVASSSVNGVYVEAVSASEAHIPFMTAGVAAKAAPPETNTVAPDADLTASLAQALAEPASLDAPAVDSLLADDAADTATELAVTGIDPVGVELIAPLQADDPLDQLFTDTNW